MSKSRGNFLDPHAVVAAFGADGARYVTLREVAFDRDTDVSWDSFVRRYNADLANDFGNLVNRTVTMVNRYLGGERPAPRPAGESPLGAGWADTLGRYRRRLEGCLLHDALAELWAFVGGANKTVDAEQPWTLNKAAQAGDAEAAAARLRGVLGDLVEACRLVGLAVAPFMPASAPRILEQLGHAYPYGADGNGGPPILEAARVGRRRGAGPRDRHAGAAVPARGGDRGDRDPAGLIRAPRRLPRPRQRGPVRRRRRPRPRGARLAGVERLLVPGWNMPRRRAPWRSPSAIRGSTRRSASIPTTPTRRRRRLGGDRGLGTRRAGGRDRRDRARRGPDVLALARPARQPAPQPRPRARDRQARDPPLPLEGRLAGRPGRARRRAARAGFDGEAARQAFGERPPAVIHSFSGPVDYAREVLAMGLAVSVLGARVPARRGGVRRGRRARPAGPPARRDRRAVPDAEGRARGPATSPPSSRSRRAGSPTGAGWGRTASTPSATASSARTTTRFPRTRAR